MTAPAAPGATDFSVDALFLPIDAAPVAGYWKGQFKSWLLKLFGASIIF